MKFRDKLILYLFLPCLMTMGSLAFSQALPMRHYTADEGLVQNQVITGYQDRQGYLWFGTVKGVSRFDGKQFKSYTEDQGLGGSSVRTIVEDAQGNLWFGFTGGIARLEGERFVSYSSEEGLLGGDVIGFWADPKKGIWILTAQGISYFDQQSFKTYPIESSHNFTLAAITGTPSRHVYAVGKKGLYEWTPQQRKFKHRPEIEIEMVGVLYHKQDQALYLIDEKALYQWKDAKLTLIESSPLRKRLRRMSEGPGKRLWLNSESEIWERKGSVSRVYTGAQLQNAPLTGTLIDRERNLWLNRWDGISIMLNRKLVNYRQGLAGKIATSIEQDENRDLWIGGEQGIAKITKGQARTITQSSYVNALHVEPGKVFSATDGGLFLYNLEGKLLQKITDTPMLKIIKDWQGTYWPYFITCVMRSKIKNRDLTTVRGVIDAVTFESTDRTAEMAAGWIDYFDKTLSRVNGKKLLFFLTANSH